MNTEIKSITINGTEYVEKSQVKTCEPPLKDYKIIRTQNAGVFAGFLKSRAGQEVTLTSARRLWYWSGAASLSQLAIDGTSKPKDCKFPEAVAEIDLTQVIEVISVTEKAKKSIEGVAVWKA